MNVIPLGAAGTVTGSRFLVTAGKTRVLVDCGLFQGLKELRLRNREPFPADPGELHAVVLTHAHLDHTGYLPVLVRDGFRGPVHVTPPTADLLPILLADAGRLQEEDAEWANRKGFSKHHPALPLFTEEDAEVACQALAPAPFGEPWRIGSLTFRYHRAGHLLGAAMVEVRDEEGDSVLFSGDLGRWGDPLHPDPDPRPATHRLLLESTYGDRSHEEGDPSAVLAGSVGPVLREGGVVMIPSFAVGRAQVLLWLLDQLMRAGELPEVPVFLNSPMAIRASSVHLEHAAELRPSAGAFRAALGRAHAVAGVQESRELNHRRGPMIIVAGSGMLTGGRILHHLLAFGTDRRNLLLLAGYQAEGTRGRDLQRGERRIRIHGRWLDLACEVEWMDVLSGHADREELIAWTAAGEPLPGGTFLVHGEPGPADHLRKRLEHETGWPARVAREREPLPDFAEDA